MKSGAKIGHLVSLVTREKISNSLKGHVPWNKGIEGFKGELNPNWKGNKVGYSGLHKWVVQQLGVPEICELCGKIGLKNHKIHWANKSHKYLRKLDDWIRLCVSCHRKYDYENYTILL